MNAWEILCAIVRAILIMSVTGSAIGLLLFALKPLIKNHIPKAVQYYMWLFVIVAFLIPFSAFMPIPVNTPLTPVRNIIEMNVKSNAEWQEQVAHELYGAPYADLDVIEQVNVSYRELKARNVGNYDWFSANILILGATHFLKELVRYLIYVFKLRRGRFPARENELTLLPEKGPRLYRTQLATAPMLVGLFRPVIYLPDKEYTESQLQNIMLHELTHWRRHDVAVKWLATLAVHIHWFNPIAYFVRREIDRACELACDEAVIKNLDSDDKQSYGDTLIAMAADTKRPHMIVSTTMCEEKKTLKARLGAIMRHKRFSAWAIAVSCVLVISVLCATVALGASAKSESAGEYFLNQYRDEAAGVRPASIIEQIALDADTSLLFYYNAKGNLGCAIIDKGVFSHKVVKTSAEMLVNGSVPAQILSGQFNDIDNWLAWGILRDSAIEAATFYGEDAHIANVDGLRLSYMIGDGYMPYDDNFLFYDGAGNLVWDMEASSATLTLTVYIWKDEGNECYSLFEGGKRDRTDAEIIGGDMVFSDILGLNKKLADYAIEGMHLYIQHRAEDFSKEEMEQISRQIEIPVGNYSTSTGSIEIN